MYAAASVSDTSSLLAELKLSHLSDVFVGESLESLVQVLQESRPKCLSHLKTLGVAKLAERQTITNGLSKAIREARIDTSGKSQPASNTSSTADAAVATAQANVDADASTGSPTRVTRLYAISDVHWDFKENRKWIAKVADGSHSDDVLVIAGDVTHKCEQFEDCLSTLKRKFGDVIFVPGNHDLWIRPDVDGTFHTSIEKLEWCLATCKRLGVRTEPTRLEGAGGAVWVVPLYSWYHFSFDGQSTPESRDLSRKGFTDYTSCTWPDGVDTEALETYFADMNRPTIEGRTFDAPVITASHFLPR